MQQLKADVVVPTARLDKWTVLGQKHLACKAAHVDGLRNLRNEIEQLRAHVTAVPDGDP